MEYAKLYNALISFRKSNLLLKSKELYTEVHHIVPKCLGGSDDHENLVRLTAREHFIAHRLLTKMYPEERGLVLAVVMMLTTRDGNKLSSSRGLIKLKEERCEATSGVNSCWFGKFGNDHPAFGHEKSKVSKDKTSERSKHYWSIPENIAKCRLSRTDEEYVKNLSEKIKDKWKDPLFKKKTSESIAKSKECPDYRVHMSKMIKTHWLLNREHMLQRTSSADVQHKKKSAMLAKFLPDQFDPTDKRHTVWEKADVLWVLMRGVPNDRVPLEILLKCGLNMSNQQQTTALVNRFKNGWVPLEDDRWLEYINGRLVFSGGNDTGNRPQSVPVNQDQPPAPVRDAIEQKFDK